MIEIDICYFLKIAVFLSEVEDFQKSINVQSIGGKKI